MLGQKVFFEQRRSNPVETNGKKLSLAGWLWCLRTLVERPRKSNGKENVIFSECAEKMVIFRGTNKAIEANLDQTASKTNRCETLTKILDTFNCIATFSQ